MLLVAQEPLSGFLLVEQRSERRDAETWTRALREGLEGLPVEVEQVTSDEAEGMLTMTRKHLKAHHTSDVFHGQHELCGGLFGALRGALRVAHEGGELRPQCEVLEVERCADHDGGRALSMQAEGLKPVAPTECDEEHALPGVGQRVGLRHIRLPRALLGETRLDALRGGACRVALALGGRPRVERLDLAELVEQRCLVHRDGDDTAEHPVCARRQPRPRSPIKTPLAEGLRRSNAGYVTWPRMLELLGRFPLPLPRITRQLVA